METTETTEGVNLTSHRRLGSSGSITGESTNTIRASSQADCFVPAGLSYDTNRDLMVDLKQRQAEKRLVEDEPGHPITKSNSEVDLPIYLLQLKAQMI